MSSLLEQGSFDIGTQSVLRAWQTGSREWLREGACAHKFPAVTEEGQRWSTPSFQD